jgi:hypothetical protein
MARSTIHKLLAESRTQAQSWERAWYATISDLETCRRELAHAQHDRHAAVDSLEASCATWKMRAEAAEATILSLAAMLAGTGGRAKP